MKKLFGLAVLAAVSIPFAGCADGGGSIVEEAEQSAVEAYQEAEAAEQAALEEEMTEGLEAAEE